MYTARNIKDFFEKVKLDQIPTKFKFVLFDIKPLFTNVLLEHNI